MEEPARLTTPITYLWAIPSSGTEVTRGRMESRCTRTTSTRAGASPTGARVRNWLHCPTKVLAGSRVFLALCSDPWQSRAGYGYLIRYACIAVFLHPPLTTTRTHFRVSGVLGFGLSLVQAAVASSRLASSRILPRKGTIPISRNPYPRILLRIFPPFRHNTIDPTSSTWR